MTDHDNTDDWRAREVAQRIRYLHAFIRLAIDHTKERLRELREKYRNEEDQQARESWEQLWLDTRRWLETAQRIRADLIVFIRDASVKIHRLRMGENVSVEVRDEVRALNQQVEEIVHSVQNRYREMVGAGTFERTRTAVREQDATEAEADRETEDEDDVSKEERELRELQTDLENLRNTIDAEPTSTETESNAEQIRLE